MTTPTAEDATDARDKLDEAFGNIEGWFKDARTHLAPVTGRLQHLEASPVVQALETAALSPAGEKMIATIITDLGKLELDGKTQNDGDAPVPAAAASS